MTSDEILQSIASLTGINCTHKFAEGGESVHLLPQPMFLFHKENGEYCYMDSVIPFLDNKEQNDIIKDWKVFFNPFGVPIGLLRWIMMEPTNPLTSNMIFAETGIRGLVLESDAHFFVMAKENALEWAKTHFKFQQNSSGSRRVRRQMPLRRRPMQNANQYDIDIGFREWGRCDYGVNNYYNTINLPTDLVDEIRTALDNDDEDCAHQLLVDHITSNCRENGPCDQENWDYDNEEASDNELSNDDTDYEAILDDIRNQ